MFRFRDKEFVTRAKGEKLLMVQAVLIFLVTSLTTYLFLWCIRELIRFCSDWWLDMTTWETYLYNWFFASISTVFGIQSALTHWLQHAGSAYRNPANRKLRRAVNEQRLTMWYFLHWFGKLGLFILVIFVSFQHSYYHSFAQDSLHLVFLIPLVLYLGLWPQLNALLRRRSQKLMFIGLLFGLGFSTVLALFNPFPTERIGEPYKKRNIHYQYDLTVPDSKTRSRSTDRNREHVYVCFRDRDSTESLRIVVGPPYEVAREVSLDELRMFLSEAYYSRPIDTFILTIILHVDSAVDMKTVREVQKRLMMAQTIKVLYNTNPVGLNLHPWNPEAASYGILSVLPPYYEFELPDDTVSDQYMSYPPPPPLPWFEHLCGIDEPCFARSTENMMTITKQGDALLVNDAKTEVASLADSIRKHYSAVPVSALFWLDLSDEQTYGEYIQLKDVIFSTINEMRSEYALKTYGLPFDSNMLKDEEQSLVRKKFPMRVWETSAAENRLREYKRKKFGID